MKTKILLLTFLGSILFACQKNKDNSSVTVELQFDQRWGNDAMGPESLNQFNFKNKAGETLSIERLRYLFSNISLDLKDGTQYGLQDYQLIDVSKNDRIQLTCTPNVAVEDIAGISMLFGFDRTDNQEGVYPDLNAAVWNVPQLLGGGYHFMQLDGKFKENDTASPIGYNFHAIRAVDANDPDQLIFEDTFFRIHAPFRQVKTTLQVIVTMDIEQWFHTPYLWELRKDHTGLMPNFEAQKRIAANGKSVFSIQVK